MTAIFAHRGAATTFRENSVGAFVEAGRVGADGVELDVRRAADGALVVHHDAAIAGVGPIVGLSVADLPADVPLLEDALAACGPLDVNIEIKNLPSDSDFDPALSLASAVASLVVELGLISRVIVSSFHLPTVDAVRRAEPEVPTGWLTPSGFDQQQALVTAADRGHAALHPHHLDVDRELVDRAHRLGLAINTWTVDDPERMVELAGFGVDTLITNRVEVAVKVLR